MALLPFGSAPPKKSTGTTINTGTANNEFATPKAIADSNISFPTKTETLTNKLISTACKLDANADPNFTYNSLYRQAIINGNFDVWQRGTSFTNPLSVYTADRWFKWQANNVGCVISQQDGTGVTSSQYCIKVQRTAGQGADGLRLGYSLETKDAIKFRGQKMTLSFWAKCGANYSPTSSYLVATIMSDTGVDTNVSTSSSNTTSNVVLTTSWQKFTLTTSAVIGATMNSIGVYFLSNMLGSAGADDSFYITQVQLCAGDIALPFMAKSFGQELIDCLRYYEVLPFYKFRGTRFGTTDALVTADLIPKRTTSWTENLLNTNGNNFHDGTAAMGGTITVAAGPTKTTSTIYYQLSSFTLAAASSSRSVIGFNSSNFVEIIDEL